MLAMRENAQAEFPRPFLAAFTPQRFTYATSLLNHCRFTRWHHDTCRLAINASFFHDTAFIFT